MASVTAARAKRLLLTGVLAAGLGAGAAGVASAATSDTTAQITEGTAGGTAATTARKPGPARSATTPASPSSNAHHCPGWR